MTIKLFYGFWCEFPGCKKWEGALRSYPAADEERVNRDLRRGGWKRDPDLCPEHAEAFLEPKP